MDVNKNTLSGYKINGISFGIASLPGFGGISGTIRNNIITGAGATDANFQNGIQVAESNTATVSGNLVSNHVYTGSYNWSSGIIISSENVMVSGNSLVNNQAGIFILEGSHNNVDNNTISGNANSQAGIMIKDDIASAHPARNHTIQNNSITSCWAGIWSSYCNQNTYTHNTISGCTGNGIYFWDTDNNTVDHNTISNIAFTNGGWGIALDGGDMTGSLGCDNNTLSYNDITTSDAGIWIGNSSDNNQVSYNNLYDNHYGLQVGVYTDGGGSGIAPTGVVAANNTISGNTLIGIDNKTAVQVSATNNYWGTCPSVAGPVTYFPYYSTYGGTPPGFGDLITNITASASSATICLGQSVTLSAANGSNFLWDNGLGLGATKLVTPATLGDHTFNVTGEDLRGCAGGFDWVTVTVVAAPTISIGANTAGGETTLTASGASSYVWSTGFAGNPLVVSPTVTTEYTVVGTNASGCTGSASHTVSVVTVTIGPDQYICEGSAVTLTATVNGATPTSYSWAPGGQTVNPITVSPVTNTEYTVTVNGEYTASVWVYVHPKPIANAGDDKILAGASVILNGSASGGTAPYTYSWTGPGSFTPSSSVQNPSVSAIGTYSLVVTDAYGCSSNADVVEVVAPPSFTYTVSGSVEYAFNNTNKHMHDVEVKLVGAQTYIGYTASNGNGSFQIPGVPNGTYTVYLSSPKPWGGVTSTDITLIGNHYRARNPIPLVGIKRLAADVVDNSTAAIIDQTNNDKNKVNSKRLTPSVLFQTGNWVFTKAGDINQTGPSYVYAHAGNTTANPAWTAFSNMTIIVAGGNVSQDFKALCYGDVDASYTGIKEAEIFSTNDGTQEDWFELSNYPNPFAGQTTFSYSAPVEGMATIRIFDLMGNLVKVIDNADQSEGQHEISFDAQGFAPGVYLYVFTLKTSDDMMIQNGKMVIMK